jgi:hypothetical protein
LEVTFGKTVGNMELDGWESDLGFSNSILILDRGEQGERLV